MSWLSREAGSANHDRTIGRFDMDTNGDSDGLDDEVEVEHGPPQVKMLRV